MKRYIALLRGINISGKNKVPMANLKESFEALGVMEVKTCLNSGNVIFSSTDGNVTAYSICGKAIQKICDSYRISVDWKSQFKALRPELK